MTDPGGRTANYEAARKAEGDFDVQEEAFSKQINQLRTEFAPFLRGELQPGEIAAGEQASNLAQKNFGQNLARAGITGGEGSQSVGAQGITKIESDIAQVLQQLAEGRQFEAKKIISQAESQKTAGLAPLEGNIESAKSSLRKSQSDLTPEISALLSTFLPGGQGFQLFQNPGQLATNPGAITGPLADFAKNMAFGTPANIANIVGQGANAFAPGTVQDPQAVQKQLGFQNILQPFGVDPKSFAQPDQQLPSKVGDTLFTPRTETDLFGNKRTTFDESPAKTSLTTSEQMKLTNQAALNVQNAGYIPDENVTQEEFNRLTEFTTFTGSVPTTTKVNRKQEIVITKGGSRYKYVKGDPQSASAWKKI